MKLQNNTRSKFKVKEGFFKVRQIRDFSEEEAMLLLRYKGIDKVEDLKETKEVKKSKKEAPKTSKKED